MAIIKKILPLFLAGGVVLICCTNNQRGDFSKLLPPFVKDSYYVSPENTFSTEKAELGRYLFYDRRLSVNNTKSCASCHSQNFSFTDGYQYSIGALGEHHQRNSRPLINLIYNKYLTAADSSIHFPEEQMDKPMLNTHPVELGWDDKIMPERLKKDSLYRRLFAKAFSGSDSSINYTNVKNSIASFIKTIISFNSPWDQYTYQKNQAALSEPQIRGMRLFFSDKLKCNFCHGGANFSTPTIKNENGITEYYFNTGLNRIEKEKYAGTDKGLMELTGKQKDWGKFRVPTLRNLAFTAPYFHDGSAQTLEDVLEVYVQGGRGEGKKNPFKNPLISGLQLSETEKKDIIRFLYSLSDSSVLKNSLYANPFNDDETR